jgi:PEP-CTERM motif
MKKIWLMSAGLVALSGSMFADTINLPTSTGQFNVVPLTSVFTAAQPAYPNTSVVNNTQPFWNDPSSDSGGAIVHANFANVGDVLSGYATGTSPLAAANVTAGNINGSYYASATGNGDPISTTAPGAVAGLPGTESVVPGLEFNFLSSQTAMAISLLFSDSSQDTGTSPMGTTFGTYIVPGGGSIETFQLGGPIGDTATPEAFGNLPSNYFNNGTVYGFYATVCYASSGGVCTNSVTYTTGVGNYSTNIPSGSGYLGGLGWNHFAFFELANGNWALGFSDTPWALGTPNSVSGLGDFNDAIFGFTASATSAAPEPGTIAVMGLGLAGLGLIGRRRFAKK